MAPKDRKPKYASKAARAEARALFDGARHLALPGNRLDQRPGKNVIRDTRDNLRQRTTSYDGLHSRFNFVVAVDPIDNDVTDDESSHVMNDQTTRSRESLMTTRQCATEAVVSLRTVQRWIHNGLLPAHRIGNGHLRIWRADFLRFMNCEEAE